MPRRMGRPGLVGTMARTAVIAGTASAVVGHSQQKQAQAAQAQAAQAQAAAAPAPAAAPVQEGDDWAEKLQQLNTLKNQGVLSEEEFTAAKAKIIASMTA